MGKRNIDSETHFETPTHKKRKTEAAVDVLQAIPEVSYSLSADVVDGVILTDLCAKQWRCGKPIGKGSFGEIFLASDDTLHPVTSANAKYVVKIEPHKSGPLFVEIHCLMQAGKASDEKPLPLGMPTYIASGGHYFGSSRCRFLILPRYEFDLHSIIKDREVDAKNILIIADQLIDILEHIHDNGYAHSDIKAENIMIGKCTHKKDASSGGAAGAEAAAVNGHSKRGRAKPALRTSRSRSSSDYDEQDEGSDFELDDEDLEEDEDEEAASEEEATSEATEESSDSALYDSDGGKRRARNLKTARRGKMHADRERAALEQMSTSHYLRRSVKRVNYCEDEDEEKVGRDDDDDWERKHRHAKRNYGRFASQTSVDSSSSHRKGSSHAGGKRDGGKPKPGERRRAERKPRVETVSEDRIHLIDFGLALKFVDWSGTHRPFVMDQRRAHDGTLEFTSRDAHMGAHSRRSDLECLAYNLIYWKEGYLPWKNEKMMSQPEQVHRMKEFFMTDIKQLYKKVYNVNIPTFIHDFLTHVANLAYHDRPDYKLCKEIFAKEFLRLGYKRHEMVLNVDELKTAPLRKVDADEVDAQQITQRVSDVTKMMKMGMIIPFCETPTSQNQISPKNLRSKSTQNPKKRRKKFSWTEILSTDPDQIARQRAEKEFEREECDQMPVRRYTGHPTYAILEIERSKSKNKLDSKECEALDQTIKGYTKPMMSVWRKRQLLLLEQFQIGSPDKEDADKTLAPSSGSAKISKGRRRKQESATSSEKSFSGDDFSSGMEKSELVLIEAPKSRNRKSHQAAPAEKREKVPNGKSTSKRPRKVETPPKRNGGKVVASNEFLALDDNSNRSYNDSSESLQSAADANQNTNRKYNSSCGMSSPASEEDSRESMHSGRRKARHARTRVNISVKTLVMSDEDSRDTTDYSPVKTRHRRTKDGRTTKKARRVIGRGSSKKVSSTLMRTYPRG